MATIGFSLSPDYLAQEAPPQENVLVRALGQPDEALHRLKESGASSIELRVVRAGTKPELVRRALDRVRRHGLGFTIHGLLPPTDEQIGTLEGFPLWEVADDIREKQENPLVVTLHARFRQQGEVEPVLAETIASLQRLLEEHEQRQSPFRFALEINRTKEKVDPSFTWENVNSMVEAVAHPDLGICWDFGHSYFNYRAGLISEEPPTPFLEKVIHTHIHDMSGEGRTHWPLREGNVPTARFCQLLHSTGYRGVYNLELDPARYPDDPELSSALYESVRTLQEQTQWHDG